MAAMDSTTSDPPPEVSLLEQFGAWLDTFPAVPPWVQWLLAALTFSTAVGGPIVFLLWRRWGANWWAARSRDSALRRATNLGNNVFHAHDLCRDRPAMLIRLAVFLAWCVAVSTGIILGAIVGYSAHVLDFEGLPPSDDLVMARHILSAMIGSGSYAAGLVLFVWYNLTLAPLFDIDRYTLGSRNRIKRMLAKAGIPQEAASGVLKKFDGLVDQAQKQEIR